MGNGGFGSVRIGYSRQWYKNSHIGHIRRGHMPDTIIMPYKAKVRGADEVGMKPYKYRLGGNTCLAGDIMGDYSFDKPLKIGDKIVFEDQIHYTMVKSTTFNGINLPSIVIKRKDGKCTVVKKFGYENFKGRLS